MSCTLQLGARTCRIQFKRRAKTTRIMTFVGGFDHRQPDSQREIRKTGYIIHSIIYYIILDVITRRCYGKNKTEIGNPPSYGIFICIVISIF